MHGMVEAGADVIELGVPVLRPHGRRPGDPEGGRPRAGAWASAWPRCWPWCASSARSNNTTPVVLMGYANPIERYDQKHGAGAFVRDASAAGVDGVLVVDYPPEECEDFAAALRAARHGPDLPAGPHQHRRAHGPGGARGQRLRVLRVAQGRDRRRHAGRGPGGGHAAAHPPACEHARGRGLWHPRRRATAKADRQRWPMPW